MALPVEQLLASNALRVAAILNLEPCRSFPLRDVISKTVLRHNSFQVHLTDPLKQRRAVLLDVFNVSHSGRRDL